MAFGTFYLKSFRIGVDFIKDKVDFLHFEIDDIVHYPLRLTHVGFKLLEIEFRLRREWVLHIGIEIDGEQTAGIVGT